MAECPWEALSDTTLPDGAKVVLAALWRHAGSSGRFVWPSRDTLANRCGMSPRTLRRHLAVLRERQWVTEAQGEETRGNPGWHLCDPPGVPVATGIEAAVGVHNRAPELVSADRSADNIDRSPDSADRTEVSARPELTADTTRTDRSLLYGNQQVEPTGGGCSQDPEQARENAPPPPPKRGLTATAWRSDWVWRWKSEFGFEACGFRISDPTYGADRICEIQRMLDDHGRELVESVLLHAAARVVRHHESEGRHGLHPGAFAVVFRADKPRAFDALLDAWQADQGRKRVSGRTAAAPAELDGVPLSDEEQRVWHRAMGEDPERAVREHREAQAAAESVGSVFDALPGFGGGL